MGWGGVIAPLERSRTSARVEVCLWTLELTGELCDVLICVTVCVM